MTAYDLRPSLGLRPVINVSGTSNETLVSDFAARHLHPETAILIWPDRSR